MTRESFLGYSLNSEAYRVFNKKNLVVDESMNVTFDESQPPPKYKELVNDDHVVENILRNMEEPNSLTPLENPLENPNPELESPPKESHIIKNHPIGNIIGDIG